MIPKPEISSMRLIKRIPVEEIAPYVYWGEPFLVREILGERGKYQTSGAWRASAYMLQYGLDTKLHSRQFDDLIRIFKENDFGHAANKTFSMVTIFGYPISVMLEVHPAYPMTFNENGVMDYSGWATAFKPKRLPVIREEVKPASATLVLLSDSQSIARSGLAELLNRHGFN